MATDRRGAGSDTEEVATAIGLYVLDEISLGKAAERLGVTRWEMRDILEESGIDTKLGPEDMEEAREEIENVREFE